MAGKQSAKKPEQKPEQKPESNQKVNAQPSYADLLALAQQNLENKNFQTYGKVSGYDVAAPYYGEQAPAQLQAASEYAKMLAANQAAKVTIPEEYYANLQRQVPVLVDDYIPSYNKGRDFIGMPSLPLYKEYKVLDLEDAVKNNFSPEAVTQAAVEQNLMNYWQSTLEHEAGHFADRYVTFTPKPKGQYTEPKKDLGLGYMANEDHLTTGLGKVQREWYAQTGQRFESPDQFKQFVLGLAKSQNSEKAISGFSEEAKRTLRPQIQNAIEAQKYYEQLDAWKANKSWFKGSEPEQPKANLDFLEKSAQLIPALVQINNQRNLTI